MQHENIVKFLPDSFLKPATHCNASFLASHAGFPAPLHNDYYHFRLVAIFPGEPGSDGSFSSTFSRKEPFGINKM